MFKAIKFISNLVRMNNEYERLLHDIILQFHEPNNQFIKSGIVEAGYIFEKIRKLQKENADLKERLNSEGIQIKR